MDGLNLLYNHEYEYIELLIIMIMTDMSARRRRRGESQLLEIFTHNIDIEMDMKKLE